MMTTGKISSGQAIQEFEAAHYRHLNIKKNDVRFDR